MPIDEIDYLYLNDIVGFFGKIKKHEELAARGYSKITKNLNKFYSYCQRLESEEPYIFQRRRLQYARSAQNCLINGFEEEGLDLYFQRLLNKEEQENVKMATSWLHEAENINKNDTIIAFMRDIGQLLPNRRVVLEPIAEESQDVEPHEAGAAPAPYRTGGGVASEGGASKQKKVIYNPRSGARAAPTTTDVTQTAAGEEATSKKEFPPDPIAKSPSPGDGAKKVTYLLRRK